MIYGKELQQDSSGMNITLCWVMEKCWLMRKYLKNTQMAQGGQQDTGEDILLP